MCIATPTKEGKKMIKHSNQSWEVGEVVKIGFMSLRVIRKEPTPGDCQTHTFSAAWAQARQGNTGSCLTMG